MDVDLRDTRARIRRATIALAVAVPVRYAVYEALKYEYWPRGYGYAKHYDNYVWWIPVFVAIGVFVGVHSILRRRAKRDWMPVAHARRRPRRDVNRRHPKRARR